jgi:hypothetical protein
MIKKLKTPGTQVASSQSAVFCVEKNDHGAHDPLTQKNKMGPQTARNAFEKQQKYV